MSDAATTKLSSKGQVVIPEEIRRKLGLEAGAQFVVLGEGDVLPHFNRLDGRFLDLVRRYSERVEHDVIALADGGAIIHGAQGEYTCVGDARRFNRGVVSTIVTTA